MKTKITLFVLAMLTASLYSQTNLESDLFGSEGDELELFFIGHGTLMFRYNNQIIHIDPVSREGDYSNFPDADLVLITHEHGDHLDASALEEIVKEGTVVIMTQKCVDNLEFNFNAFVMGNGDVRDVQGMKIEAIPAYNVKHKRA